MTTIKSYTNIEQSKKLAKILPLESADMYYIHNIVYAIPYKNRIDIAEPCWSLAALLSVLPDSIYDNTNEFSQLEFSKRSVAYHDIDDGIKVGSIKDNIVDAAYELILKLHELNLL